MRRKSETDRRWRPCISTIAGTLNICSVQEGRLSSSSKIRRVQHTGHTLLKYTLKNHGSFESDCIALHTSAVIDQDDADAATFDGQTEMSWKNFRRRKEEMKPDFFSTPSLICSDGSLPVGSSKRQEGMKDSSRLEDYTAQR